MLKNHYKINLWRKKRIIGGPSLYGIEALIDGPWGKAGTYGGYVESEKNLEQGSNAWIGKYVCVYGNAKVYGNALIVGYGTIYEDAEVFENAKIFGFARVFGKAKVSGEARVSAQARIYGNAEVSGNAQVYGHACVFGNAKILMNSRVYEMARVSGKIVALDESVIRGSVDLKNSEIICGKRIVR